MILNTKRSKDLFKLALFFLIFCTLSFWVGRMSLDYGRLKDCTDSCVESVRRLNDNLGQCRELSDLDFIEVLNQKFVDAHNYSVEEYNCVNYSVDYMFIMRNLGYNVSVAGGKRPGEGKGHAWNRLVLDFEPQSGKVTNHSEVYSAPFKSKNLLNRLNQKGISAR